MEDFIVTVRGREYREWISNTWKFAERVAYRKGFRHAIEMMLDGKTESEQYWEER